MPGKLFTFPTFSDTDDPDTTYNELPLSDTSSETESNPSCRLLSEDIDTDTDFSPFQDHSRHLPRPSCIQGPTKQLIKPCNTQSKENKSTTHIYRAKPPHMPVYKEKKSHTQSSGTFTLLNQRSYKLPTVLQCQATKPPQSSLHKSHLKSIHTHSRQENHLYCQCQLHQLNKQLFQDHHNATDNTITSNAFQEHSAINYHHYYHCHCTRYQHLQDHINMDQDTYFHKYLHTYQCYYHPQVISSAHYHACMQYKIKNLEDRRHNLV